MSSKTARQLVLATATCLVASPGAFGDISVRFETPTIHVDRGSTFTVNIVADISEPVVGWGLDLTIDSPEIVSLVGSPVIGPQWYGAFAPDGDGLAGMAWPTSVSGDNVLLASLTFSANDFGTTRLGLGATFGDMSEGFPLDPAGFATVDFGSADVMVNPTPGAATLGMMGLLLIGWTGRRVSPV